MHNTCVWLKVQVFFMIDVSCASQQNILYPHIMSLFGVPTLSTSCSTPPPSQTPSPQTDRNQIKPLCTPPRGWAVWPSGYTTTHHIPSESFVKNQIACLARIVLCEHRLGRKPRSMSSLPHCILFSFTFFFCDVFSEISAFTQNFPFFCPFSV